MSSLSAEDVATLKSIGEDTIRSIVALCVEAIMYTIYGTLVVMAGRIMLQKGRSNTTVFLFLVCLLMYCLDTVMCIIDVHNAIYEIKYTLTSSSSDSLADRYNLINGLPWPAQTAVYAFMSNLGDVIIIWRVYAFWSHPQERWVLLIPLALLTGSVVASILTAFCAAEYSKAPEAGGFFVNPPFCKNVQLSSYVMTLVTTAVATVLIGYKTWLYRRTVGRHLHSDSKRTRVEKIMVLLVESGVLYFFFFLKFVVGDIGDIGELEQSTPQLNFANTIWTYMSSHLLGIYPVLVVILVHKHLSYIEATTASMSSLQANVSSIECSSRSTRSGWSLRTAVQRPPPIEINVHELHMRRQERTRSDDGMDSVSSKKVGDQKVVDDAGIAV